MTSIKGFNGKFVRSQVAYLVADSDSPLAITTELQSDGTWAIKQGDNYWSVQPNGDVQANRPHVGPWEKFSFLQGGSGGRAIQSVEFKTYLSMRQDSHNVIKAVANNGPWEEFFFASSMPTLWPMRGVTDFRLLQMSMKGEDLSPVVHQRLDAGARTFRVLGMKADNTGWDLIPQLRPDYVGDLRKFFDVMGKFGARVYFTIFADTAALMPNRADQGAHFDKVIPVVQEYQDNQDVVLEYINEWNHPTQRIDPRMFPPPANIVWWSRGSAVTDADPATPYGTMAGYSARRDVPPSAKGFTNYDPDEFQSVYPQPTRKFAQEGIKPPDYRFDVNYARKLGAKARENGGFFHTAEGVNSQMWPDQTVACAVAFYEGMLA